MTELARFTRRLNRTQAPTFKFERASLALLSRFKHYHPAKALLLQSEWRDPPALRIDRRLPTLERAHG